MHVAITLFILILFLRYCVFPLFGMLDGSKYCIIQVCMNSIVDPHKRIVYFLWVGEFCHVHPNLKSAPTATLTTLSLQKMTGLLPQEPWEPKITPPTSPL